MSIKTITAAEVFRLSQESGGITIIDVRESDEFAEASSPLAENFPLSIFDTTSFAERRDKRRAVYMLCRSGKRSLRGAQLLESVGFEVIYNIEGGMIAWEASGLPILRRP